MIDLGDFRDNPMRVGAWSIQREPKATVLGLVFRLHGMPAALDETVSVQIDSRRFVGRVFISEQARCLLSDGWHECRRIVAEGHFTEEEVSNA